MTRPQWSISVRERAMEVVIATGIVMLAMRCVSALPGIELSVAVVVWSVGTTVGICAVAIEKEIGTARASSRAAARLALGVVAAGALATLAWVVAWVHQYAFASALVRRIGVSATVAGLILIAGLFAKRGVDLVERVLRRRRRMDRLPTLLRRTVLGFALLFMALTADVWLAPGRIVASTVMLSGIAAAIGQPYARAHAQRPQVLRAVAIVALASWLVLLIQAWSL